MKKAIIIALAAVASAAYAVTNNVTISESTTYSKDGASVAIPGEVYQCELAGNGLVQGVQEIPSTGAVPLVMSGISTQGFFRVKNIAASNTVDVGTLDGSANFIPFVRLTTGRTARVWLSTNAPYARANGSTVRLWYMATDN